MAEEGSGVQSMFSVFSVFPNIFPHYILRGSLCISVFYGQPIKSSGGAGWSNAADSRGDVEQILLAGRNLPKDDGGERIP